VEYLRLTDRVADQQICNIFERFNNTLRQRVSRLVRETLSFSKTLANHIGAIKYFICHDNLTRRGALPVYHYPFDTVTLFEGTPDTIAYSK
jgi:hypothetical protein